MADFAGKKAGYILKIAATVVYVLGCFLSVTVLSELDKEWMIGGGGIRNVCDLVRAISVENDRDVFAPLTGLLLMPLLVLSIRQIVNRRAPWLVLVTLVLILYWWWRFWGRLLVC